MLVAIRHPPAFLGRPAVDIHPFPSSSVRPHRNPPSLWLCASPLLTYSASVQPKWPQWPTQVREVTNILNSYHGMLYSTSWSAYLVTWESWYNSFISSGDLYSTYSRDYYSEALPASPHRVPLLSTFVSSVDLSLVLWARDGFVHLNRVFSWSTLLVPPLSRAAPFSWWVPRSGMGSLLNFWFSLEPCHLRFFLTLRLLFLAVLESRAPLSSSLEEALYEWMNEMNEWMSEMNEWMNEWVKVTVTVTAAATTTT